MYFDNYYDPVQSLLLRHRFILVLMLGFCCAFLLGLLLWNLTTGLPAVVPPAIGSGLAPAESGPQGESAEPAEQVDSAALAELAAPVEAANLSPVFAAEVRYWEPQILAWAAEYELDPNLVATLMQIESCGNPRAVSSAGARGLFQVMPFHFAAGEEMLDPATNARRGLDYLVQSLTLTEGHVGMALAGYNGGHTAALGNWVSWPLETRRYYRWGSGIYNDVTSGLDDSPTLHDWLAAGGASLCQQAAAVLESVLVTRAGQEQ